MPPSMFNLISPLAELRQVSPDLRSDRYADAVRRADARSAGPSAIVSALRHLADSLTGSGTPNRLAAH